MATDWTKFCPGLFPEHARVLGLLIDGATGADFGANPKMKRADILGHNSFNGVVAVELERQIEAGEGRADYLMALGIDGDTAAAIKAAIDARQVEIKTVVTDSGLTMVDDTGNEIGALS